MIRWLPQSRWRKILLAAASAGLVIGAAASAKSLRLRDRLARAQKALDARDERTALGWLDEAERLDPHCGEVHLLMARAYRRQGNLMQVESRLAAAEQMGVPRDRVNREWWLALAQYGWLHEVEQQLPELLMNPGEDGAEILEAYINGFCLNLRFGEALQLVDVWQADFPHDPKSHIRRGDIWLSRYEWRKAAEAYRAALEIAPHHFGARQGLARALFQQNAVREAAAQYRVCLRQNPSHIESMVGLGNCLLANSQLDDARDLLMQVFKRDPGHFEAQRLLGEIELAAGKPQQALHWLQPLAGKWPEDSAVCYVLAKALQEVGQQEQAKKHFEVVRRAEEAYERLDQLFKIAMQRPRDVEVRYEIGDILLRHKSRPDGAVWLESVLLIDPKHGAAHRALADYYAKQGDEPTAEEHRRLAGLAGEPQQ